jgi:solute carrier family 50 protein (sugar transporter)
MKVAVSVTTVIIGFCTTAIISALAFHDHHHRKVFIGSIGIVASVAMYGSPLVVVVSHH